MGFKKSHKSACKNVGKSEKDSEGEAWEKCSRKPKGLKKATNSNLGKLAISQGLAHVPKLYDIGTSKIKNKKIKKLLQSDIAKVLLNDGIDKAYSKL